MKLKPLTKRRKIPNFISLFLRLELDNQSSQGRLKEASDIFLHLLRDYKGGK
jgi:hypothetical protein